VESLSATEGAPAAGSADIIVDITTTGSTLSANKLKIVSDGVILKSQAILAASRNAAWSADARASFERILDVVEARAKGKALAMLRFSNSTFIPSTDLLTAIGASAASIGETKSLGRTLYCPRDKASDAAMRLQAAGAGAVAVLKPDYVFEAPNPLKDAFAKAIPAR
jgi:ATP phosphoribosyltransferase